ncbi:Probable siderophore transport system ATP-binding protein YusV [uncultured Roseburia sp.]|uniref:ABC transporter ATP-binding protein n=1 Tax=Brotonthovivens ammoniilytica TaxID=2981725 RepID=A0ABT2TI05_9FIRM|nr:ABC transporter ATP-binding protein [Brotonthovivens ammoniilytica]MCU6761838.1 ABC transporter ATP-binding protein [Brotonthovivens ammoniilytica]SCI48167.1 Probable siderophore transport system ATP-binding protein YusV [uncultured Roseburia sp.]
MNDYFIYTDKMTVGYSGKPLIKDIEIRVNKGEILTLIGPNGAGKSTILKSITRQLGLIAGTVYLDGKTMERMTDKEVSRKLSVVMTERLNPELMTCEDVVGTGRYPYTGRLGILSDTDRMKVREAMEMVHARELADCDFTQISDGQRQRILLARAICQEPEIIVLDEPTSFLDIRHKLELLTILKQMVSERNVAVIMSLHELDLAQKISDLVVCVNGNKIERYGSPEDIFSGHYISELYHVTRGSYNEAFGCLELEAPKGKAEVFVIGGNGSGIALYRKLQRRGIPFAVGILHENDVDYQVAKALASQVISVKAFEPIDEKAFQQAAAVLEQCGEVYCCLTEYGTMNQRNRELKEYASEKQLLKEYRK